MGCGDDASSSKLEGDVEMSSMQTRFFALGLHNPHHYNQSLMLVPSHEAAELDAGCFHRCLVRLAEHHDMLRASSWSRLRALLSWLCSCCAVHTCALRFPEPVFTAGSATF